MVCQKAAPTWLPFVDVNYTLFISPSSDEQGSTYTLAGLEVNLFVKSWLALLFFSASETHRRGARVLFQSGARVSGRQYVQSRACWRWLTCDWVGEGVWEDAGVSRRRGGAGGGEVEAEECLLAVCARARVRMFWGSTAGSQPQPGKR